MPRVLIIGGYGNFGRYIARRLAADDDLSVIVAGRSIDNAISLARVLDVEAEFIDINHKLNEALVAINPDIVIHTSGPFQTQGYGVAKAAIACGAHYIDLADGREFVAGIHALDERAKQANVLAISGASSVPCLSAAVIDHFENQFETLESVQYGITTAQRTTRGIATTAAILGYTGKPFLTIINGERRKLFGWQGLHARTFGGLGRRWLSDCNVPDLALFPERYPALESIRFSAGLELSVLHLGLWLLSWVVRIGLVRNLAPLAPTLLKASFLFDSFGTSDSGFYMRLSGKDSQNLENERVFELIARSGDGPYIPCIPAILLARKLARRELTEIGAKPCLGFISLEEYLGALEGLDITWQFH